jgi:peptidoglycan/LPS O-acetylase OafA/YrhL
MVKHMEELIKKIGSWLFLVGILLAVIVGIVFAANATWYTEYSPTISTLLAVLGFIVGVLSFFALGNITRDRVPTFLIAALMLVGIGAALNTNFFADIEFIGPYFTYIAAMIAVFVAPAAGILAIRAIWDAGKTEEIEKVMPKIPK